MKSWELSPGDQWKWLAGRNAWIEKAAFVSRLASGDNVSRFIDRSRNSRGVKIEWLGGFTLYTMEQ